MAQDTQQNSGAARLEMAEAPEKHGLDTVPATSAQSPQDSAREDSTHGKDAPEKGKNAFEMAMESKPKRTPGLWIVDNVIYQANNFAVFAISVVATYLTSHGDTKGGKFGKFMHRRGTWLTGELTGKENGQAKTDLGWLGKSVQTMTAGKGLKENQADMVKMVTFSFLDGTLMAPFVKMMEDRREKMAQWIDKRLGKEPEDKSVYAAEPKQSWGSVLMGRFLVAGVVVPTAVLMDKITVKGDTALPKVMEKISGGKISAKGTFNPDHNRYEYNMNDLFFNEWGLKTGEKFVAKHPDFAAKHKDIHIPGLFKTGFFEAFYTSVCTAGLYVTSRFIAKKTGKGKDADKETAAPEQENPATTNQSAAAPHDEAKQEKSEKPQQHARNGEEKEERAASKHEPDTAWASKVGGETRQQPPSPQQKTGDWQSRSLQEQEAGTARVMS